MEVVRGIPRRIHQDQSIRADEIQAAFIAVDPDVVRNTPDWDGVTTRVTMRIPRSEPRIEVGS